MYPKKFNLAEVYPDFGLNAMYGSRKYEIGTRVTLLESKLSHQSPNPNLIPT